jgi:heat shock protein HslJ
MKKYIFIVVIIVLVFFIIFQKIQNRKDINQDAQIFTNLLEESEYDMVSTVFLKDSVIVSSEQIGSVILQRQENNSEGQEVYSNEAITLVRSSEDKISLTFEDGIVVFQGELQNIQENNIFENNIDFGLDDIEGVTGQYLEDITSGIWQWEQTQMNNDDVFTPNIPGVFTLNFTEEGLISGTTDCNSFAGSFALDDTRIQINELAVTRMFCENSQESQFIDMIQNAQYVFFTEGGELVLLLPYDSGSVIFTAEL